MAQWPQEISKDSFRRAWTLQGDTFWEHVFELHKLKMQIKSPKIAIVNLQKIFKATFKLVYAKGFQAMSLRDLSKEAGLSMGGLYAYIGSKEDLASAIQLVLRQYNESMGDELTNAKELSSVKRLKALIFGEIYMMEQLYCWYYFCYMELKGLPKELQLENMELELTLENMLISAFKAGVDAGEFVCERPDLLASQVTATLQQWYLKYWKLKSRIGSSDDYAQYVFESLLTNLRYTEFSELPQITTEQ